MTIDDDEEYFTPHRPIDPQRTAAAVAALETWLDANPCAWKFEERPCMIESRLPDPMILAWAREPPGPFVMLPDARSGHATACVPGKCAAHCPQIRPIPLAWS